MLTIVQPQEMVVCYGADVEHRTWACHIEARDETGASTMAQKVIPCQRDAFGLPTTPVYISCASRSPMLQTVSSVGQAGMIISEHYRDYNLILTQHL